MPDYFYVCKLLLKPSQRSFLIYFSLFWTRWPICLLLFFFERQTHSRFDAFWLVNASYLTDIILYAEYLLHIYVRLRSISGATNVSDFTNRSDHFVTSTEVLEIPKHIRSFYDVLSLTNMPRLVSQTARFIRKPSNTSQYPCSE